MSGINVKESSRTFDRELHSNMLFTKLYSEHIVKNMISLFYTYYDMYSAKEIKIR